MPLVHIRSIWDLSTSSPSFLNIRLLTWYGITLAWCLTAVLAARGRGCPRKVAVAAGRCSSFRSSAQPRRWYSPGVLRLLPAATDPVPPSEVAGVARSWRRWGCEGGYGQGCGGANADAEGVVDCVVVVAAVAVAIVDVDGEGGGG